MYDAVLRLFLLVVTAKYIPIRIRRCNSVANCAVTSNHYTNILESLPKAGDDTPGDSRFLENLQLGTSTFQSSKKFYHAKKYPNASLVP
ncbi:hypothetical protein TNCV_2801451 [Trichonephila clavipes]|nr:hypothetical protein TNCV_2801451 [Trichonephila clavipes]